MISKEAYDQLKKEFGNVASWAIWKEPSDMTDLNSNTNIGDLSVFSEQNEQKLLAELKPEYVFVGLNPSREPQENCAWSNFHDEKGNDYRLRAALMKCEEKEIGGWGGYITDFLKEHIDGKSEEVKKKLKGDPELVDESILKLKRELELLGGKPILIAMGRDSEKYLKKHFLGEYNVGFIYHYSRRYWRMSKIEDYVKDTTEKLYELLK